MDLEEFSETLEKARGSEESREKAKRMIKNASQLQISKAEQKLSKEGMIEEKEELCRIQFRSCRG